MTAVVIEIALPAESQKVTDALESREPGPDGDGVGLGTCAHRRH